MQGVVQGLGVSGVVQRQCGQPAGVVPLLGLGVPDGDLHSAVVGAAGAQLQRTGMGWKDAPVATEQNGFETVFDTPIAWPNKQHSLLTQARDDSVAAFVDWWPASMGRRLGFQKAAEALAQVMLDANHSDRDTLVYPWLMCWRHYVELQLKHQLETCENYLGRHNMNPKKRNHQRILDLWNELKPVLEELRPEDGVAEIRVVDRLIRELSKIDPDSMHSRYPETTKGDPTMMNLAPLDVVGVHEAMTGMANFFDGVEDALNADEELRQEIDEEYDHERDY